MQVQIIEQERIRSKEELRAIILELQSELKIVPRDDIMAISQVAEKAWVAFVTYVKVVSGRRIRSHTGILENAKQLFLKDKNLNNIYWSANALHIFHYAPFIDDVEGGGIETIINNIQYVLSGLKIRMKKLPNN